MRNKPLIITTAIGILLLALGSWLYLFLFGAPQSTDDVFTDLGITPTNEQALNPSGPTESAQPVVDTQSNEALRQLTLRAVAGFTTDDNTIRYAEQGTGHIYEIDLDSGNEARISNTTVPTVTRAIFNADGTRVVLVSEEPQQRRVTYGAVQNGSLATNALPPQAKNVGFRSSSSVHYTLSDTTNTTGYVYSGQTNSQREDFVVPFSDILFIYNNDQKYVINRPAVELEGAIFKVSQQLGTQLGSAEFGLHALFGTSWYAVSYNQANEFKSVGIDDTGALYPLPVPVIPEKCAWVESILYCAAPVTDPDYTYMEDWYKGTIRSNDALWQVIPNSETATLLTYPSETVGRAVDMTALHHDSNQFFFINRFDNTLWVYDQSIE